MNNLVFQEIFEYLATTSVKCVGRRCNAASKQLANPEHGILYQMYATKENFKGLKSPTFQTLFDQSFGGQRRTLCDSCKKQTLHDEVKEFLKLPPVLLTQVNRVTNAGGKYTRRLPLPTETLEVPIHESVRQRYLGHTYRLRGVISHMGATAKSGHYISYVRTNVFEEDGWVEINDDTTSQVNFKDIAKKSNSALPYILAWELQSPSPSDDDTAEREEEVTKREDDVAKKEDDNTKKEGDLVKREGDVAKKEEDIAKKEEDVAKKEEDIAKKEEDVAKKEEDVAKIEEDVAKIEETSAKKEKDSANKIEELKAQVKKISATPQVQKPAAKAGKTQVEQEVDDGTDTATFTATFNNVGNATENARAIFKIANFNPDDVTQVRSTIQLTDDQGQLRAIKKNTTVSKDPFLITFNVKGAQKRKRAASDDNNADTKKAKPAPKKPAPKTVKGAKKTMKP